MKLVEYFFDYINENFQDNGIKLFSSINRLIKLSIDYEIYKLTEFILDYFNKHVRKLENMNQEMNTNLIDYECLKKLNMKKNWHLIKMILDCSDLSDNREEKFCFSYFDYQDSNLTCLSVNNNMELIDLTMNDETPFLPKNKIIPIKQIEQHPLYWMSESGQKNLKNHQTTLKHLSLKWQKLPLAFYILVTLLQFIYLIMFSYVIFSSLETAVTLNNVRINLKLQVTLYLFWLFFTLYEMSQLAIEGFSYFCYEVKSTNYKKFNLKNLLELITSLGSLILLIILFHHEYLDLHTNFSHQFCMKTISYIAPLCLLLRYIVFILCLEKASWFGIYIVAFRRSFENSLYLLPLVLLLFSGFIISFGLKTISYNENFVNLTVFESITEMQLMVLANIDRIENLGMKTNDIFTNYILFSFFIFLMPVLLINLLIGVSTGQLEEVLHSSEVIQYEMRVVYTLRMQNLLLNKLGFKFLEKYFLFNEYQNKRVGNKLRNNKLESDMMAGFNETNNKFKIYFDLLRNKIEQNRSEILSKMSEQNDKFQTIQEDCLERMNQNDKKTERQLKDLEDNFLKQFDSLALDIMNKTN